MSPHFLAGVGAAFRGGPLLGSLSFVVADLQVGSWVSLLCVLCALCDLCESFFFLFLSTLNSQLSPMEPSIP
jgi:hypothetical protein